VRGKAALPVIFSLFLILKEEWAMDDILLEIKNVAKNFGPTHALKDINLIIKKGTVHSLLGRNGAGKSTLVNIIAGLYRQDVGQVFLEGQEISHLSISERQAVGISIVPQHASVIPELSVGENIFIGSWPKKKNNFIDWAKLHEMAAKEFKEYGLEIDTREKIKNLTLVEQRKVNIVRSLYGGAKLIILDEPTTALSSADRDGLFKFIKSLSEKGTTFIFITHYLDEVIKISDDITVLRDGQAFTGYSSGTVTELELANLISGENVTITVRKPRSDFTDNDVVLECKGVCGKNMEDISFKLHRGEIVGMVGIPGSGAREVCRAIYGLHPIEKGEIIVNGELVTISKPKNALKNGIVYIPSDRHAEGLVGILTIQDNVCLPILKKSLQKKNGFLNTKKAKELTLKYYTKLKVKANSINDKIDSLSGGNQQKVLVSKALTCEPKVLILDEPTVGIDIKSREEILSVVKELSEKNLSAIYITNDFDELLRMVDVLIFFRNGKIKMIVKNQELEPAAIIKLRDSSTFEVV